MNLNAKSFITILILATALVPAVARADAEDDPILVKLMLDQLEKRGTGDDSAESWDAAAWVGKDLAKIWFKSEGERSSGRTDSADLQLLYSKAVAAYWDIQAGIRHDFEPSSSRTWLAIGFNGLAPYFFRIDSALFIGESGRTALRIEADYDLLMTQKLVLTPEIEANFYGKDDPAAGIGSGLSDLEAGLRLRFEIGREFAPYVGIHWSRKYGKTADFGRIAGEDTSETQFVLGIRAWF